MLEMLRDLVAHKGHADAVMLRAIRLNDAAAADSQVSELLHHVLLANRFWLLAVIGSPFVLDEESRTSSSFEELVQRYKRNHEQESAWCAGAVATDLDRVLEVPPIPGGRCTVSQAWMQVCLHSQGHRAQCATLLRRHGSVPPTTDFILRVAERPAAAWTD